MSAIFGMLGSTSASNGVRALRSSFTTKYECDRSAIWFNETCGLGTLEQWINKEEEHSPQPFRLDSLIIVFDGMLDYRDDLKEKLNVGFQEKSTDAELVAKSFMKWGIECVEHLMGIFAFAVYDESINEMWIVRDRLGERAVCYTHREDGLMFSTTPKPIATYYDYDINETFLKQYAVSPMQLKTHDPYIAPWEKIQYVPPGHVLHYQQGNVTLKEYWAYQSQPERTFRSEEECHEELDKILEEATRTCTRTDGEVGLMLSGGLDSTTVAAYAAPLLQREDKSLHAYTHVPLSEYEDSAEILGNERPLVEEVLKYYPSIKPNWIENRERNAYNTMDDWLEILEMPYGFFINAPWLLSIHETAKNQDVRVMLNGKHGNCTISYGSIGVYYSELFRSAQFSEMIKEFYALLNNGMSVYTASKKIFGSVILSYKISHKSERLLKKHISKFLSIDLRNKITYRHLNLNEHNVKERLSDSYERDHFHFHGVFSTMCSLRFNCVVRDPLSSIQLIDFCSSLSSDYFASKGVSKKLVRSLMKNRLPLKVLDMNRPRGRQSADWNFRLINSQNSIMNDLQITKSNLISIESLDKLWNSLSKDIWTMNFMFRRIIIHKFKGGES
ncbi:asparagine synthetase B family protein [Exiguobacterium aestuarii]|uniref:asparagine synthase (glutamine-hydrolyzing) n=1 Tax=Exiguobacterium aestuarii TaxID=273527 RepID=A0ABW2PHE7_9BACL|nr:MULTISPECIES: asparagine synthase-related protein [Exiguobacterium]MCT4785129.1 asparagine synthase-related protein [Exiguobacterium aestuarii]